MAAFTIKAFGPSYKWHVDIDRSALISRNLTEFLRANLEPGQEAELAIHPQREEVLVFVDDELVLTCTFDELLAGPGHSLN